MKNNILNELQSLRMEMEKNQLAPWDPIIADGEPHTYPIVVNGELHEGIYMAFPYATEVDQNGPALIGWY